MRHPTPHIIAVALLSTLAGAASTFADGNPLNGASRRPFYIFGHNPNTLADARAALSSGANALEPDVQVGDTGELVIAHGAHEHGRIRFADYLDGLRQLATQHELALVVFDVKPEAATPAHGVEMVQAIRRHLNTGGIDVCVIISVATRQDGAVFDGLLGPGAKLQLGPREGVQIDEEDDAGAIANYFLGRGYRGNICFGDGTLGPGPHLPTAIDGAAWCRATRGFPVAVTYVYTIEKADSMRLFIDAGADGIITDDVPTLAGVVRGRTDVFLATRKDDIFKPLNEAYGLQIRTTTGVGGAGTDATLTFTLAGAQGSAVIAVNTALTGRMEAGCTNYVTLPSKDLGALKSITVFNDGHGNRPDWNLQDITVLSAVAQGGSLVPLHRGAQ